MADDISQQLFLCFQACYKSGVSSDGCFIGSHSEFLEHYVFPILLPALEEMLKTAKEEKCFEVEIHAHVDWFSNGTTHL